MPFPHEAILGLDFFSALVDAFPYHSWPSAEKKSKPENCLMWKRHSLMWTLINLYIVGNWANIFNVKKLVKC